MATMSDWQEGTRWLRRRQRPRAPGSLNGRENGQVKDGAVGVVSNVLMTDPVVTHPVLTTVKLARAVAVASGGNPSVVAGFQRGSKRSLSAQAVTVSLLPSALVCARGMRTPTRRCAYASRAPSWLCQ